MRPEQSGVVVRLAVVVAERKWEFPELDEPVLTVAVRLAAALDWEHGGEQLGELAGRLDRTEALRSVSGRRGSARPCYAGSSVRDESDGPPPGSRQIGSTRRGGPVAVSGPALLRYANSR